MISKKYIPNRRTGEEIVMHARKHPFIFLKIFIFYLLLFFIPPVVYYFITLTFPSLLIDTITQPILLVVTFIYYLMMLVFVFTIWMSNYLDVWTITTNRIISRDQEGLFNRTIAEIDLSRVQDVTSEQRGILATFLNYGEVYIQSAAEKERFVFSQVPNPNKIALMIQQLSANAKKGTPNS